MNKAELIEELKEKLAGNDLGKADIAAVLAALG